MIREKRENTNTTAVILPDFRRKSSMGASCRSTQAIQTAKFKVARIYGARASRPPLGLRTSRPQISRVSLAGGTPASPDADETSTLQVTLLLSCNLYLILPTLHYFCKNVKKTVDFGVVFVENIRYNTHGILEKSFFLRSLSQPGYLLVQCRERKMFEEQRFFNCRTVPVFYRTLDRLIPRSKPVTSIQNHKGANHENKSKGRLYAH